MMGTEETAPLAPTCSLAAGHLAGDRGKNCYSSRDEWGDSSSSTSASASTSSTPQTSAAGTDVGPGSVRPPPAPRLAVSRAVAPAHGVDLLRGDKFTPQTFPPELLGICFAFLGFLRVDLVACALVCRNWLVPALQQLYRSPWFRTRNAARKFADLVAAAKQGHTALDRLFAVRVDKFVKVLNFEHEACEKLLWDADHVNKALNACENITHLRMGGLGRRPVWYHPPAYIFDVAVLRRNLRVVQYNDNCVDVSIGMQRIVRLLSNLPNLQKLSVYGELSSDNGFHHLATLPGTLPEDVEIPVLSNPHQSLHSLSLKAEYFADAFVTKLLPFLPNLIRVRFGSLVHQPAFLGVESIRALVKHCRDVRSLKLVCTDIIGPQLPEIARLIASWYGSQLEQFRLIIDGLVETLPLTSAGLPGNQNDADFHVFPPPFSVNNMNVVADTESDVWFQGGTQAADENDMEEAFSTLWQAIAPSLRSLHMGGSWMKPEIIRSLATYLERAYAAGADGAWTDVGTGASPGLRNLYMYAPHGQPVDNTLDKEAVRLLQVVGPYLVKLNLDGTQHYFGDEVGVAVGDRCRQLKSLTIVSTAMSAQSISRALELVGRELDQLVLMSETLTQAVARDIPRLCPYLGSLNWINTRDSWDSPLQEEPEICSEDDLIHILQTLGPKRLRAFLFSDYKVTPRLLHEVQRSSKRLEELWLKFPPEYRERSDDNIGESEEFMPTYPWPAALTQAVTEALANAQHHPAFGAAPALQLLTATLAGTHHGGQNAPHNGGGAGGEESGVQGGRAGAAAATLSESERARGIRDLEEARLAVLRECRYLDVFYM